jgi:hypothetical protein
MPISPSIASRTDFETDSEFMVYKLFNSLFGSCEDKWVFANVNYVDAGRKLNGQVDFIYLDNEIILFVEVKGGAIHFDERTQKITKDYGGASKDPFKQVTDYLYDFRNKKIKDRFGSEYFDQKIGFGYCVLLPSGAKPPKFVDDFSIGEGIWTIEYSPKFIGDIDDLSQTKNFLAFLKKLKQTWRTHKHNSGHNGLSLSEVVRLASFIRDNLSFEIPLPKYLQINDEQTVFYTKKQGETLLNLISRNKTFGFLINGGPGSGKTLIARELLIKRRALDESVLFICRNKSLADFLRSEIKEENAELLEKANIIHLKGLFEQTLKENTFLNTPELPNEKQLCAILIKNKERLVNLSIYDYLIIDEGQDLFFRENIEALELYIKGGFKFKHFSIFMDKDTQNSYGDFEEGYFNEFLLKYQPVQYMLESNCRNTKGIIETSNLYTGVQACECMKTANLKERPAFWDSENELLNLIKIKTNELLNKKVLKRQITILSDSYLIKKIVSEDIYRYEIWDEEKEFSFRQDRIMVMTPESFKGLENNIIIFTGTSTFNPERIEDVALWHIAFTRAKDNLYLFLPLKFKDTLLKLYLKNSKKLLFSE